MGSRGVNEGEKGEQVQQTPCLFAWGVISVTSVFAAGLPGLKRDLEDRWVRL
jgi:hypothetical protein